MFHEINGYFASVTLIILVAFTTCLSANDQVPTFNLKNKSANIPIILQLKTSDKRPKRMCIRSLTKEGHKIIYDGLKNPHDPILVLPEHDISYYDVHYLEFLFILDKDKYGDTVRAIWFNQNRTKEDPTYYLKYCNANGPFEKTCTNTFGAQEGIREKLFAKKSITTDGYSLENNIKNTEFREGVGRPGQIPDTYIGGIRVAPKKLPMELPMIDFNKVEQDYYNLIKK